MTTIITPYLPNEALSAVQVHERTTKKPAFVTAYVKSNNPDDCPNCQGIGFVMVKFCKSGPFFTPAAGTSVITWYEGSERFGAGWYIVEKTQGFPCPKCEGKPAPIKPFAPPPDRGVDMDELLRKFEHPHRRREQVG